ncbi:MAG: RNA-binding protein [Dehalococcoidia bacterium]|nr:RNA-binding protein [Dehalococcoidia bacterium]
MLPPFPPSAGFIRVVKVHLEHPSKGAIEVHGRIFVGGIPFATTDTELQTLFASHGAVDSASIVKDRYTDQSRGFAFVDMPNEAEAKMAITRLNGTQLGGRSLTVNEAKAREAGGGGGGNRGGGGDRGGYGGGDNSRRY